MNKTELVKAMTGTTKLSLVDTEKSVNALVKIVSDELKKKGKVTLVGFGTFSVSHRKKRIGRNPRDGSQITIPARNAPVFKAGKTLKELVK